MLRNANSIRYGLARIYDHTLDLTNQAAGYIIFERAGGGIALALVCYAASACGDRPRIPEVHFAGMAWIAVFLIVPVYSGDILHGNLALCGYACCSEWRSIGWRLASRESSPGVLLCWRLCSGNCDAYPDGCGPVPDLWNSYRNLSHQFTVLSHPPVPSIVCPDQH